MCKFLWKTCKIFLYRMLNCVNTTGHPGGGGPESSALIEEKLQPPAESCEEEYDYNNL